MECGDGKMISSRCGAVGKGDRRTQLHPLSQTCNSERRTAPTPSGVMGHARKLRTVGQNMNSISAKIGGCAFSMVRRAVWETLN